MFANMRIHCLVAVCAWSTFHTNIVADEGGDPERAAEQTFLRGDNNEDGLHTLADALTLLNFLFPPVPQGLGCMDAADTDDSGRVELADALYLLNFLFLDGPWPPDPFWPCGFDRTPDGLTCEQSYCDILPEEFTNGLDMRFVYIPPGSYLRGSPPDERGREGDEGPQHTVHLTCGFYMSVYEVTQRDYEVLMGNNPSYWIQDTLERPVENVTWNDARNFCRVLSQLEGRSYRLPTEAEWEYACRAGTTTRFSFGDALECDDSGWNFCEVLAEHMQTDGAARRLSFMPLPVGQKQPNPWGLYDMHGNVWEWCLDGVSRYPRIDAVDPFVPPETTSEPIVVRGGAAGVAPAGARSAARHALRPSTFGNNLGFRVIQPLCHRPISLP